MDVFYSYTYGTFAWLALQSLPLLASPTLILAILSPDVRETTVLEEYFARSLGITLFTLGVLCVVLTGSVPLTSTLSDSGNAGTTTDPTDPKAPYALPTLTITTIYHSVQAFYAYARWTTTGSAAFGLGVVGGGALATMGGWCILFASSNGRISRKTGVDKRQSGWPFKNAEADRRKVGKKGL